MAHPDSKHFAIVALTVVVMLCLGMMSMVFMGERRGWREGKAEVLETLGIPVKMYDTWQDHDRPSDPFALHWHFEDREGTRLFLHEEVMQDWLHANPGIYPTRARVWKP